MIAVESCWTDGLEGQNVPLNAYNNNLQVVEVEFNVHIYTAYFAYCHIVTVTQTLYVVETLQDKVKPVLEVNVKIFILLIF